MVYAYGMFENEQAATGGKGKDCVASVLPILVHLVQPGPPRPLGPVRYGGLRQMTANYGLAIFPRGDARRDGSGP
jgi:hypothetical protein